jgi:hypothetical protein
MQLPPHKRAVSPECIDVAVDHRLDRCCFEEGINQPELVCVACAAT